MSKTILKFLKKFKVCRGIWVFFEFLVELLPYDYITRISSDFRLILDTFRPQASKKEGRPTRAAPTMKTRAIQGRPPGPSKKNNNLENPIQILAMFEFGHWFKLGQKTKFGKPFEKIPTHRQTNNQTHKRANVATKSHTAAKNRHTLSGGVPLDRMRPPQTLWPDASSVAGVAL